MVKPTPGTIITPIDAGIIARVVSGVRYIVGGKTPEAWFGPGEPIQPVAQEVQGRNWDYAVTTNLQIYPRAYEGIKFHDLRGLSESFDILRLIIETRKDQITKLAWCVQPKDKEKEPDKRCEGLEDFFQFPDKESDWATWLRKLIEDLLVIDAPALYVRMNQGNKPYGFEVIDGATIKRLITSDGRTPLAPDPAYQQILHGLPAVNYSADQLIYMPRNPRPHKLYGYSPVEQIIITINTSIRKQIFQQQYYTEGTTPDAIIGVPKEWSPSQVIEFQEYWDGLLTNNTAERRKVRFVADGVHYTATKTAPLKDEFDEWLARIVCYAFGVAPTPFIHQLNRSTANTSQDAAIEEGLQPIQRWVKSLMDRIIIKYFGYNDLEFAWVDQEETDPLIQAQIDQIYVTTGIKTVNEVRADLGMEAIKEPVDNESDPTDDNPPPDATPKESLHKKKAKLHHWTPTDNY